MLGINARNLLYIKPFNSKSGISFADNKLKTKQFLSARGIRVPKLLAKISTETEREQFNFSSLPNSFVLKPNSGYGGAGIIVAVRRDEGGWKDQAGQRRTIEEISEHVADILDGRYSITGSRDIAFFEQRLISHPDLGILGRYGLPDIRVIVYNMVPVMAMIRIPTRESEGKANMQLGGLGAGVDLAKGEITHVAKYNHVVRDLGEWDGIRGMKIPMWEEVLLIATKIQTLVTLGYLAVDIVIDEQSGPTLLEINARAGLKVQVANLAPLRDRLDRVSGVKVMTPEKGVRMAQDLFGNKIEREIEHLSGKQVIGLEEPIILNLKHGTKELLAKVNPSVEKNYLHREVFDAIRLKKGDFKKSLTLNYTLAGVRGKSLFYPLDMKEKRHQVIMGARSLKGFLVDVTHRDSTALLPSEVQTQRVDKKRLAPSDLMKMDSALAELDQKITLVSALRPLHLEEERKKFFASSHYEPMFRYRKAKLALEDLRTELLLMTFDSAPLGELLQAKRTELLGKLDVLESIGNDLVFPGASEALWGLPPKGVLDKARHRLSTFLQEKQEEKVVSDRELAERFSAHLQRHHLGHWEVVLQPGLVSRCTIGKRNRLLIRAGERFSEQDVEVLLAHEIETHLFCIENGRLQPYRLFERGFANSLRTQEGLAVYRQALLTGSDNRMATLGILAVDLGRRVGFRELYDWLLSRLTPEEAWMMAVKVKRGMADTKNPGSFTKNALYFWGWMEVERYVQAGGDLKRLYTGKIALEQLDLVAELDGVKEPVWWTATSSMGLRSASVKNRPQ